MSDEFHTVARVGDLEPGEMTQVRIGRKRIALYNVDGEYFATDDTCTHEEASLTEGFLYGDIVECPLHGAAFNVRTGEVEAFPAVVPVDTFEVRVVGDEIQINPTPR
ncbi:MAG TPA: non-heme iron oxygenase ferredoxin subunit [Thermomicrobiales bacterium]|nr:non-heme iron oxygenase ferredoxin subunit [Thermomicrobiales bacterium]